MKKHHYGFFSIQNGTRQAKNERKKKSFLSVPSQSGIRISKKHSKEIQKIKKHHYGFFPSQNGTREAENERKWKFSFRTIPTGPVIGNSKKIAKKFKKLKPLLWFLTKPRQDGIGRE